MQGQRSAARRLKAQAELQLPRGQPLLRRGLQSLQLSVVMRRPDVLDLPRPPPRRPHDLHRHRARLGLHRPQIRHEATLRAIVSAQLQLSRKQKQQVNATPNRLGSNCGPTRVNSAKYTVIGVLEERLPASPYWRADWKALGEGRDKAKYWPMTHLEQWIPVIFAATYVAAFIAAVTWH